MKVSFENGNPTPYSLDDLRAYNEMVYIARETGYDNQFELRTYDPAEDPLDLLRLERHHVPAAAEINMNTLTHIGRLLEENFINPEDRKNIIFSMMNLLFSNREHLENGGNLAIATNHMSYADLLLLLHSLAVAKIQLSGNLKQDGESILKNHHVIVGRSVSLFKADGLKADGSPGYIVDDVLHQMGGVFQTLPTSQNNGRLSSELRETLAFEFFASYMDTLEKGGQIIFVVASGKEDLIEERRVVLPEISKTNALLFTEANRTRRKGKPTEKTGPGITTIPLFLDWQPLDEKRQPAGQTRASIGVGDPIVADRTRLIVPLLAQQLVTLGNKVRLPATPKIVYEVKETEKTV